MEILRVTIAAGERKSFHKSGRYFEVMKASAPFDVHFTDRQIGVYPCIGLEAGVYSELPFQSLDIVSSSAQTVTLMISDYKAGYRNPKELSAASVEAMTGLKSGVPAVGGRGGWVSGIIAGLAPSASNYVIFDLGDYWSELGICKMGIFKDAGPGLYVNLYSFENAGGSDPKHMVCEGVNTFSTTGVTVVAGTTYMQELTFRPSRRYVGFVVANLDASLSVSANAYAFIKAYK